MFMTKGTAPIEKSIAVVDENGNKYEATYPKRAKGLVKNGRARFIDEKTICLVCPPENKTEDNDMPENEYINANDSANPEIDTPSQVLTLNYVLSKIDALQNELTDLKNTVNNIGCVSDTDRICEDSEDCSKVNAEVALAKIKALTEVFHHREESLQKLLAIYEKMYEDLISMLI